MMVKLIWDGRPWGRDSALPLSRRRVWAREARPTCFHSPVAEILRSGGGGGDDTRDRGRVAQGDRERNDQNRGGHASSRSDPTRVTLVDRRGGDEIQSRILPKRTGSARVRVHVIDVGEKSAKFLPPGRIAGAITGARTRWSVISASRARVFADNAVPGEGEWATSPRSAALITAHRAHYANFGKKSTRHRCRSLLSGGR